MAGYSGTPLPEKLGISDGTRFAVRSAPMSFDETLGPLPPSTRRVARLGPPRDLVLAFHTRRADLLAEWTKLCAAVEPAGAVWVAWPKKSSGLATDISENALREDLLPTGWVDTKVCAIDDTWSGLRFVLRKELRPASASARR